MFKNNYLLMFLLVFSGIALVVLTVGVFPKSNSDSKIFYELEDKMYSAYKKGDHTEAKKLANEYLLLADNYKNNWNYGNAIYSANEMLGLISLREGKVKESKQYLLEAGKTPGSPQLNSFGPSFRLARELLIQGEKEVVLDFLDLVEGFWIKSNEVDAPGLANLHRKKMNLWIRNIENNKIPDDPKWVE